MTADIRCFKAFAVSGLVVAWGCASAAGQKRYDVGVTDSEIKIGNLMPYSGPASAYAAIGTASTTNAAGVDASRDIISAVYLRD